MRLNEINITKFDNNISEMDFNKALESASQIKLKGGMFTKACVVLIVVAIVTLFIAWIANNLWTCLIALVLLFGLVFFVLWRLMRIAEKNPYAVLFEGAELFTVCVMPLLAIYE